MAMYDRFVEGIRNQQHSVFDILDTRWIARLSMQDVDRRMRRIEPLQYWIARILAWVGFRSRWDAMRKLYVMEAVISRAAHQQLAMAEDATSDSP